MQSTPPTHHWSASDQAYFDAMESRRAASLRRRLMWFCIIGMFLMAIGSLGNTSELLGMPIEADPTAVEGTGWWGIKPSAIVLFISCTMLVAIFAAGLVYTLRTKPYSESEAARTGPRVATGRHRLVVALSFISIAVITISVPAEVIAQWCDLNQGSPGAAAKVAAEPDRAAWTATNAYGIFFCLACVTVPMRWRESLRIAVPGMGILLMTIVFGLMPEARVTAAVTMTAFAYALVGTAWGAWRYADFDARLRAHALGDRYTDLSGQVSEISAELKEARKLHESLFPRLNVGETDSAVRIDYRYQPARQIGGDFLFVHREPASATSGWAGGTGGATVVVIDVSGHGVAAALAVNRLHGELLRFFSHYPKVEREAGGPGHLLSDMNTYACAALAQQGVYATALIVHIDPAAGKVAWASAGHPTAFLLRARAGTGVQPDEAVIIDLESTSTMLGVLPPELFFADERSTPISPGDVLLAYTDGAVESRDAKGEDYTPERLRATFAAFGSSKPTDTDAASPPVSIDALMAAIESHRHGRITDDTLLVEVALDPHAPKSPAAGVSNGASRSVSHPETRSTTS